MIFIDADAFIALNFPEDALHARARKIAKLLDGKKELLVTSWDAVDEATTRLSRYSSKEVARKFLKYVFESDIRVVYTTGKIAREAELLFAKQRSKMVSLTDCVNMIVARDQKVTHLFSFDKHYVQNGFTLLE